LTNEEKRVLLLLRARNAERATPEELASGDMPAVAINRAALGLESRKLITIEEQTASRVTITRDGEALINEIPERAVGEAILATGATEAFLDDLALDKRLSGIAMGWLRKRGWADVEKVDGRMLVKLTKKAVKELSEPSPIAAELSRIAAGGVVQEDLDPETLSMLKSRKAVDVKPDRTRYLRLSDAAKAVDTSSIVIREEVTQLTPELLRNGKWREVSFKKFDVSIPVRRIYRGKKQPYLAFLDTLKAKFVALGFQEMRGPLIESEFWNFDALFQPQNHPARDWTDTYRLINPKQGHLPDEAVVEAVKSSHERSWGYSWDPEKARNLMPRAHGTCLSARQLNKGVELPGKYFSVARCFRPDVLDRTHLIEFNQIEGIICDTGLTFRNLLGVLKQFAVEIAGAKDVRFYPDYYPFTEPSVQMSAKHPELGWVEFGGAGIFRKELTQPLGVDAPVIAWGLGVDRLAMFKLGIDDIRFLFSDDITWLRNEEMI
jgi:phenylalanyl-tRNA synthetase alpha chain